MAISATASGQNDQSLPAGGNSEQSEQPEQPEQPEQLEQPEALDSLPPVPDRFAVPELMAVEQLVLMLSNSSNQEGAPQESLVFLGRAPQQGWSAIGVDDVEELRSHWRSVARRLLAAYNHSRLSQEKKAKIELAVELSITQFVRLYISLRADFLEQPDQKSKVAFIANDGRYEQLRLLGREGLFKENSLVGKALHAVLADQDQATP
jgi:hypothetical protein